MILASIWCPGRGPSLAGTDIGVGCIVGRHRKEIGWADYLWCRLVLRTWNIIFMAGKEHELLRHFEQYQLHIVGLTSMHCSSSGTWLLERGLTLLFVVAVLNCPR